MRPQAFLRGNVSARPEGARNKVLILRAPKCSSPPPPSKGTLWIASNSMSPHAVRTPGGPPLWVVVHVMVKCIEGLYELWRVREMYTLTQVERHRALTTKFSKAQVGPHQVDPLVLGTIHFFVAENWRNIFQTSSIATEYRRGPYKRRLKNCFKDRSLVGPAMSIRHMQHFMSMNALAQGPFGLEAAKALDIEEFV